MHYVYLYQNKVNLKIYIGQTKHLNRRHKRHLSQARRDKPDSVFECAIKKYGSDNFDFCVIEQFENQTEADDAEQFWIEYFESRTNRGKGYNVSPGGMVTYGMLGKKHSQKTKKKMSKAASGEKNHNYGVKLSTDIKHKMSDTRKRIGIWSGENNMHAKLTRAQVDQIRLEYNTGTLQKELAKKYNVSEPTISDITRGKSWK